MNTRGATSSSPLPPLPAGWTAYTDVATYRTYYVHGPTGDTQWDRPAVPPPPPPPPATNLLATVPPRQHQPLHQAAAQHYSNHHIASQQAQITQVQQQQQTQHVTPPVPTCPALSYSHDPQWQPHSIAPPSAGGAIGPISFTNPPNNYLPASANANAGSTQREHHQFRPAKRQCIPQKVDASRKCAMCGLTRIKMQYSSNQWAKASGSKCRTCAEEFHSVHCTPKPKQNKACSACEKSLLREMFSKRQWSTKDADRKCKACAEMDLTEKEEECERLPTTGKTPGKKPRVVVSDTTDGSGEGYSAGDAPKGPKICITCDRSLPFEMFSKRQWNMRVSERKCKDCVAKILEDDAIEAAKWRANNSKEERNGVHEEGCKSEDDDRRAGNQSAGAVASVLPEAVTSQLLRGGPQTVTEGVAKSILKAPVKLEHDEQQPNKSDGTTSEVTSSNTTQSLASRKE